ncbi:MAG TPA: DUF4173 domain-containing protein [Gemmatimonadaceae bacterium]|nr:DUF4173 domain-containing protein [Gemmatimonadaceae bacterium]
MEQAQSQTGRSSIGTLWTAALAIAALGTWVLFDSLPGINWLIWTASAAACLLLFPRLENRMSRPLLTVAGMAILISGGAVGTADPFIGFLMFIGIIGFLALEMLLSPNPVWQRVSAAFTITAPIVAFGNALVESIRRAIEALHLVRSPRARSIVGGIAITLPVVIIFGLLLASADPLFARWRDAIDRLISSWDFLPRTVFFIALLSIVLGAYGFALKGRESSDLLPARADEPAQRWIGATERLILISSVAALLWVFLLVQLTYLFGNLPEVTGSGVTFADYARRGFAELSIVASASAVLILLSERFGKRGDRDMLLRAVTMALVVAVLFLLGSAFHRVSLYEQAYGFTTARLYAQAYMIVVAICLLLLGIEIRRDIDTRRLFRRAGAVATLAFLVLVYWNHEAWIAARNIDRFTTTGKLDVSYLVRDLSPNAIPVIVERIPSLPAPVWNEVHAALLRTYGGGRRPLEGSWYEWNLARSRARAALDKAGIPHRRLPAPATPAPAQRL